MGVFSRVRMLVHMKSEAALDGAEDPREVLDYAFSQQQRLLRKVKQGLIEVATSKRRLERQLEKLNTRVPQMERQAERAIKAGRDDLARIAVQRKQTALAEITRIEQQHSEIAEEERRLTQAQQQLAARVEEFRTRRDVISATYTAAEAQVKVGQDLSGVSDEVAELSMAVGRAEERADRMRSRASAIDALMDAGTLEPVGGEGPDFVERQLGDMEVEDELQALKDKVAGEADAPASEGGDPNGGDDAQ